MRSLLGPSSSSHRVFDYRSDSANPLVIPISFGVLTRAIDKMCNQIVTIESSGQVRGHCMSSINRQHLWQPAQLSPWADLEKGSVAGCSFDSSVAGNDLRVRTKVGAA